MAASSEDEIMDNEASGEDDLFGDEDDGLEEKTRELSDRELDSGDDEDRTDRAPRAEAGEDYQDESTDARVMETTIWRHAIPKPADGEVKTRHHPDGSMLIASSLTRCDYHHSWALTLGLSIPILFNLLKMTIIRMQNLPTSPLVLYPPQRYASARIHLQASSKATRSCTSGAMDLQHLLLVTSTTNYRPHPSPLQGTNMNLLRTLINTSPRLQLHPSS